MSYLDNVRTFVRVYELGNMSAAARDQHISPAVASSRVAQLEAHLGVRLFERTTRSLSATDQGRLFYEGACRILGSVEAAEAAISEVTTSPRGILHVAASSGLGRRLIAPHVPQFSELYPLIELRLRLSDRRLDFAAEGLDIAFMLGDPEEDGQRIKRIAECPRLLCASPSYIARAGMPGTGADLEKDAHSCLTLRSSGSPECHWNLRTSTGPRRFAVKGRFESDDGDVLTDWALAGHGITLKPAFEVAPYISSGELVVVAEQTPPVPTALFFQQSHRQHPDPKLRLFLDFMTPRLLAAIAPSP
ncbi:LysR family transcriptional regulator [Profundibacterium mesophilum]|uniref:DNA polymerase III subunit beta n=1 Tax=Profundibacterium mesophilum KAUST100406-0324 TaxID=1037889 RepID=A0A921NQ48_9RHOB|nr:LysR family transcriptional regulator [Profundibacterium mesophilum]KAF0676042.1 DNA polymerase III subunit beta [Profundibacterium mesophilum KAUST100406-0324]